MKISVEVTNTGAMAGDEVVQLYLTHPGVAGAPIARDEGISARASRTGEKKTVSFTLSNRDLSIVDPDGKHRVVAGTVEAWIGGGQP